MIASLGVAIAIRHLIQAIWGPQILSYDYEVVPGINLLGGFVTRPQLGILITVPLAMIGFHLLLQYTQLGKAMRATAANPELAQASGIDTDRIIRLVWFIGSGFAALGGALLAWDTQLDPQLGFDIVIPVFACVLIGGVGSVYGAILGALIVGIGQNVLVSFDFAELARRFMPVAADWSIPVSYKPAVVYVAVILLEEQDRSLWDRSMIHLGLLHLELAARGDKLSAYHLQAEIAATHSITEHFTLTNWENILSLYDLLRKSSRRPWF